MCLDIQAHLELKETVVITADLVIWVRKERRERLAHKALGVRWAHVEKMERRDLEVIQDLLEKKEVEVIVDHKEIKDLMGLLVSQVCLELQDQLVKMAHLDP